MNNAVKKFSNIHIPKFSDAPADEPAAVSLIASGYDWECPACQTWNHVHQTCQIVACGECGTVYTVDEAVHAKEG